MNVAEGAVFVLAPVVTILALVGVLEGGRRVRIAVGSTFALVLAISLAAWFGGASFASGLANHLWWPVLLLFFLAGTTCWALMLPGGLRVAALALFVTLSIPATFISTERVASLLTAGRDENSERTRVDERVRLDDEYYYYAEARQWLAGHPYIGDLEVRIFRRVPLVPWLVYTFWKGATPSQAVVTLAGEPGHRVARVTNADELVVSIPLR